MSIKQCNNWGLVVPGRPPTPSEGHAQSYARVGPEYSQRLITFDNGTCLSFGPDDLIDEFGPGHPFADQVALIDKAVRDCLSITQRHPTNNNDDNQAYRDFRTNRPFNASQISGVSLSSGIYFQLPSKYASVGTLISVHAQRNKSDVPGEAHPGLSADTRFGVPGRAATVTTLHEHIRRETDREREDHVRKLDEITRQEQHIRAAGIHQAYLQEGKRPRSHHRHRPTRRGRRALQENNPVQQQEDSQIHHQQDLALQEKTMANRSFQMNGPLQQVHGQSIANRRCELGDQQHLGCGHSGEHKTLAKGVARPTELQEHFREHAIDPRFPMISPEKSPSGAIVFEGPYPQHMAAQILNHVYQHPRGGQRQGETFSTSKTPEMHRAYDKINQQNYEDESDYSQAGAQGFPTQGRAVQGTAATQPVRDTRFARHHRATARRAEREFAIFLDEENRRPPNPEVAYLRGDTFAGEPVLQLQPPTPHAPSILMALCNRRELELRAQENATMSVGSHAGPIMGGEGFQGGYLPAFNRDQSFSTESNDSERASDESVQRGRTVISARSSAADERRGNSIIGSDRISQSGAIHRLDTAFLAQSGRLSRDVSPIAPLNRRLFESRCSSPGAQLHVRGQAGDRSASAGRMG